MRVTEDITDVMDMVYIRFKEGKDENYLNGYIEGINEYDELEHEKYEVLSSFVYLLFNYNRKT